MASVNQDTFTLNTGYKIPKVGFGAMSTSKDAIIHALKQGYRHIDTAYIYGKGINEVDVGKAIKESGIPRDEIFVVSKLWNTEHKNAAQALDDTLERLGLDYLDGYLIHWPHSEDKANPGTFYNDWNYVDTYRELVKIYHSTNKIRSLGVSNFTIENLNDLANDPEIDVIPAINQIEAHPLLVQPELVQYLHSKNILIQAYCPLGGTGAFLTELEEIKQLADKYNITPGQVLISWAVQRGTNAIPRSSNFQRIEQNIKTVVFDDQDFQDLNNLSNKYGVKRVNPFTK